ncbi:uncharacterized protein [Nicotiana sylvestris]|uniref:uncharacterized protein n=1 Tax=Nicotiana sylvestris TaxID=4096 RepID=UPI00388C7262
MEKDCFNFVRKFHQCQVHGDLIHAPPAELHPMSAPWPFVAWGMDVIGPIKLKASNGHRFILVAIDYFTKWVEAITLKSVTKKTVVDFVHSHLICRFGIPATIITDKAANLNIIIPAEVEIPSLRIIVEAEIEDSEGVKTQMEQLTLIDEKRMATEAKGKFAHNWKGPYIIRKILPKGALYLGDIEGNDLEAAVNADAVKRCNPRQPCKSRYNQKKSCAKARNSFVETINPKGCTSRHRV